MLSITRFVRIAFIGLLSLCGPNELFSHHHLSETALAGFFIQSDSLRAQLERLDNRINALEIQNNLLIRSMELQVTEAERKARFLEITLAILGGLLGVIVAIITISSLRNTIWERGFHEKKEEWERKFHEGRDNWERKIQDERESREGRIVEVLQNNVQTVTNLMNIISEGQQLADKVKESVERQREQTKWFKDEISAINSDSERLQKEGTLKRRMVRQREVQGEFSLIGDRIEKILLLLPLIPFDHGEGKLSATAYYVRAVHRFILNDYIEARKLFTESRHLVKGGDLLWQIPYYEGMMAKNEGKYETAIAQFEEAIIARQNTDLELGSRTEIAEITCFKWSRQKKGDALQKGMIETRSRCLDIIQKAEGIQNNTDSSLLEIVVGKNPNMTDEFRRLQARCFLIAGNSYWLEGSYDDALKMYQKSAQIKQASVYAFSSIAQAMDKLNHVGGAHDNPLDYFEKAFNALQAHLGRSDEYQNRVLRISIFALCVKKLKEAKRIDGSWEPIQYRIQAERIIGDELKFKNQNIRLFSPFSKIHMDQNDYIEELRREVA